MKKENDYYNHLDKGSLRKKLEEENFERVTISFYRYTKIENVNSFRDDFFKDLKRFSILGRIYLATEGINAQFSIPENNFGDFKKYLQESLYFKNLRLNIACEESKISFYKLVVKVRRFLVADGLTEDELDLTDIGEHLSPLDFHNFLDREDIVVVDVRNSYESEIGYFKKALRPKVETYRESLDVICDSIDKDKTVLMYCTGGIRCEKASAYLKQKGGFKNVKQLEGGIINYANTIKKSDKKSKFVGANFVFDGRLTEKITDDVLSSCHQCGNSSNTVVNCSNDICHLLFIQCEQCFDKYESTCSKECCSMNNLTNEKKALLKKQYSKEKPYISPLVGLRKPFSV